MRFHVLGLPHTQTTTEYCACAYTQKIVKFCRMMHARGHEIFLYSGEDNDAPCTEHVVVITRAQQREWFGEHRPGVVPPISFNPALPAWRHINSAPVAEIRKRALPGDFVLIIGGNAQKPLADAMPGLMCVEYGIGYEGVFSAYRCFESHAWRHYIHGMMREGDGRDYDAVIPNYFDPAELPFQQDKEDYCLFIGRIVRRKGPQIAVDACRALGCKLLVAGQQSDEIRLPYGPRVAYCGVVGVEERAGLMGKARAVFVPTQYLEPFGGVAVEAMMCGTPVITSDYGAFPETVVHGFTGFRCHTLAEYVAAADTARHLDPQTCRRHAMKYSLASIAPRYEEWFARLATLQKESKP